MASCYMRTELGEYPYAIRECKLLMLASPRYSKALLRRSRCLRGFEQVELLV